MIRLSESPIDPVEIFSRLSREGAGSVLLHVGFVKPIARGKRTRGVVFTTAEGVEQELDGIEADLVGKWDLKDIILVHGTGRLEVGNVILVAAVSAETRVNAFGACRDAVEHFKAAKTIIHEELFE